MNRGDIVLVLGDGGVGKTTYINRLKIIMGDIECYEGTIGAGMIAITAKQPTYVIVLFNWSNPLTYVNSTFKKWIDYARKNFTGIGKVILCGTQKNDEIIAQTTLARCYLSVFPKIKISELHQVIGWKYGYEDDVYYHTIDATNLEDVRNTISDYGDQ